MTNVYMLCLLIFAYSLYNIPSLMIAQNQLLDHFGSLSTEDISKLDSLQMKALLSHFHSQMQSSQRQDLPQNNKNKSIRKFSSKPSYKRYIRNNISKFINRVITDIRKQKQITSTQIDSREIASNSAYSKFKKSSHFDKKRKMNNFYNYMGQSLQQSSNDDLACPICLEVLVCPTLTICGHVFCFQCLDESLLFSNSCPNCRQNIKGFELISCQLLEGIIDKKCKLTVSNGLQQSSQSHYFQRKTKFTEWRERRYLNYETLSVGQIVDARDTQNIWCQGTIVNIYHKVDNSSISKTKVSSVLLHYNRWHKLYNEIIQIPTNRLAPLNCFSSRTEIPRYHLSEEEDNMRGTVVSGTRVDQNPGIFIQIAQSQQDEEEEEEEQESNEQSVQQIEEEEENAQNDNSEQSRSPPFHPFNINVLGMFRNHAFLNFPYARPYWTNQQINYHPEAPQQINELSNSVLQIEQTPQIPIVLNEQGSHYLYRHGNHYDVQYNDFSSASVRQVSNEHLSLQQLEDQKSIMVLDCESSSRKQNSFIEIKDSNEEQKENDSEGSPKIIASIQTNYLAESET